MTEFLLVGMVLMLLQIAAALPWLAALDAVAFKAWARRLVTTSLGLIAAAGTLILLALIVGLFYYVVTDLKERAAWGRGYASVLQLQLCADLLVLVFVVLLRLWPQGGAVTLAAFREGMRQPMFWLLTFAAVMLMAITPLLPYFTFGEDYRMVKEIGYDIIMLAATAFGVIAASMSISEEIEGKTAITLMSKPVSRRQFLLGKFGGILLAAFAMTAMLGWFFIWMLYFKGLDSNAIPNPTEDLPTPVWVIDMVSNLGLNRDTRPLPFGIGLWANDLVTIGLGFVLCFGQLMVLLAVAVALATRLPMIVNLVVCLAVFFLGHLTAILVAVAKIRFADDSPISKLVTFTSQVFNTILPGLEYYDMGNASVRDTPLPPVEFAWYVLSVTGYSLLYSTCALLLGLILFEDRDLA